MRDLRQTKAALWAFLIQRCGFRDAGQLVELIEDWRDYLVAHDGEVPSFEAYAKWTRRYSYRTAYRRLALLRRSFLEGGPELLPDVFLTPLIERLKREGEESE